jgi:hypothetical protein
VAFGADGRLQVGRENKIRSPCTEYGAEYTYEVLRSDSDLPSTRCDSKYSETPCRFDFGHNSYGSRGVLISKSGRLAWQARVAPRHLYWSNLLSDVARSFTTYYVPSMYVGRYLPRGE